MTNGNLDLSRLSFDLEEMPVKVVAKKDMEEVRIDRIAIHLIKDKETEVPLWVAEILEEQDLVKIKADQMVNHGFMARLAHRESENRALESVDSLLFRRVRIEIENLRKDKSSSALRKLTSIEGNFNKLLRLRFRKLLHIVMIDNQLDGSLELTEEEKWLYTQLNEISTIWQKNAGLHSEDIA